MQTTLVNTLPLAVDSANRFACWATAQMAASMPLEAPFMALRLQHNAVTEVPSHGKPWKRSDSTPAAPLPR
jgi:hypothetical protein